MKIALVLYPINDLGGIINHVEHLGAGLREIGHTVNLHVLCWQENFRNPTNSDKELLKKGWSRGTFGVVHQFSGWNTFPWKERLFYKGKENLKRTKEILSSYDLIIWEVPVPTKVKINTGNSDWLGLYDCCDKNIAIVHDGNLMHTSWIYEIRKNLVGLACVHECAFNIGQNLDVPRAMILNPQNLAELDEVYDYQNRQQGFLSVQVFKAWKHVCDVIRAIPYLPRTMRKTIAGGGIEQRYMTSKFKTKESYYCRVQDDPDMSEEMESNRVRIWERALYSGMEYLGFISSSQRDTLLRQLRTLIDPSWSLRYSENGSHFNRVVVEAIKMGTIPIATNLGMSDNLEGEGAIFKPKENYIMIPYDFRPKDYAGVIEYANNLSTDEANKIIENNYDLLDHFDRRKVAQDFIDLANKKKCGFFNSRKQGKEVNKELKASSKEEMEEFFGKGKFKR